MTNVGVSTISRSIITNDVTAPQIKMVKEHAKKHGGLKKLEAKLLEIDGLVVSVGSLDKIRQAVDFLNEK